MANVKKPEQRITDFDALYQQAKESQPLYAAQMNEYLTQLKTRYPGVFEGVVFEQGPLKTRDRALSKINADYEGNAAEISDLVRGRFVVNTAQQADILRKDLSQRPPFKVEQLKDQFAEPLDTLFRAENAKIRLNNGHLAELRVEHKGMLEASNSTHKLYEEMQEIERRAKLEQRDQTPEEEKLYAQKRDEIRVIHDRAAVEGNLDPLLNDKGRAAVEAFRQRMGISVAPVSIRQTVTPQVENVAHQNPVPILVSQHEHGPQLNPNPILVPQGERAQTPSPVPETKLPAPAVPELPPERVALPGKIGMGFAIGQLAIGPVYEMVLTKANDGNAHDIAQAGLHGLANSALPGVADGFKNITENNSHQNWIDQTLNAGTTLTQGIAVGSLVVAGGSAVVAPVTGGASLTVTVGSLAVAGAAGIANLGVGLVHDVTYVTHVSKQGGLITGLVNMGSQLVDSKAGHRTVDWFEDNNAKLQYELDEKGVTPNQLTAVDKNHDGKIAAQEARDYLVEHHVPIAQVNKLPAIELADTLASTLAPSSQAAAPGPSSPAASNTCTPLLSPDMQRALQAAFSSNLSGSILGSDHPYLTPSPNPPTLPPKVQGVGVCR
ncbi:MAG: hypothetical protein LBF16_03380 [Pseudomonadales bacterium]|jgi:hypothetical protein|nr:hypothetical protein [Pseudomonadales bacterium]